MISNHSSFEKRFNSTRSMVVWVWRIMLAAILVFWIGVGFAGYKIYQNVDFSHGLQGVVNQVWTGEKVE